MNGAGFSKQHHLEAAFLLTMCHLAVVGSTALQHGGHAHVRATCSVCRRQRPPGGSAETKWVGVRRVALVVSLTKSHEGERQPGYAAGASQPEDTAEVKHVVTAH